jgi:hypothetical protein
MPLTFPYPRSRLALAVPAAFVIAACHGPNPLQVLGSPAQSFAIVVGQELTIEMGGVGPSYYVSPPTLSGSTVEFTGENALASTINTPGGEPQLFHFKGVEMGQTIILFQGINRPDIADTVIVR